MGYFRSGTVWLAWRSLRAARPERTAELLAQVRFPGALSSQQRAYYEFASGIVASSGGRASEAESHLRTALSHRLRTESDRSLVEVELARILAGRGETGAARELVQVARGRRCRPEAAAEAERLAATLGTPT